MLILPQALLLLTVSWPAGLDANKPKHQGAKREKNVNESSRDGARTGRLVCGSVEDGAK